ncbi:MAG: prepilin-type N-terminal cleavage/methylation domain-containing protein [Kiritimatiellia bacterium]
MKRFRKHSTHQGFSLIEILVAMTILTVIVLIVARIFQQTGLAWSLGLRRADAQSVTRAVLGSITRDLSMMVDPCNFVSPDATLQEKALSDSIGLSAGNPISSGLDFWILRPTNDPVATLEKAEKRELVHIVYAGSSGVVNRTETVLDGASISTEYKIGKGSVKFESLKVNFPQKTFSSFYEDEPGVKITVKPETPPDINDYEISVASSGPDGEWGTDDDIRPWVKGEDK